MDPPIEDPRQAVWLEMEDKLHTATQRIAELEAELTASEQQRQWLEAELAAISKTESEGK